MSAWRVRMKARSTRKQRIQVAPLELVSCARYGAALQAQRLSIMRVAALERKARNCAAAYRRIKCSANGAWHVRMVRCVVLVAVLQALSVRPSSAERRHRARRDQNPEGMK